MVGLLFYILHAEEPTKIYVLAQSIPAFLYKYSYLDLLGLQILTYVVVYYSTLTVCSIVMSNRLWNTVCVEPICCLLVLNGLFRDQPLTQEAEERLHTLPAQLPTLMPGGREGGKPGFKEKETHDCHNNNLEP